MEKKKVETKVFQVGKGRRTDSSRSPIFGPLNTNLDFYDKKRALLWDEENMASRVGQLKIWIRNILLMVDMIMFMCMMAKFAVLKIR